jgi:hypothetical protein
LITKITDPPPAPRTKEAEAFVDTQVRWTNKHEFMSLPLTLLDAANTDQVNSSKTSGVEVEGKGTALPEKRYS